MYTNSESKSAYQLLSDGVFFDLGSSYSWNDLYEQKYLFRVACIFREELFLKTSKNYNIFIFSATRENQAPSSIACALANKILIVTSDEGIWNFSGFIGFFDAIYLSFFPVKKKSIPMGVHFIPVGVDDEDGLYEASGGKLQNVQRRYDVLFEGGLNKNRLRLACNFIPCGFFCLLMYFLYCCRLRSIATRIVNSKISTSQGYGVRLKFYHGFNKGIERTEFLNLLESTKIAICPPGFASLETFRHFEAASRGCVVITLKMPNLPIYEGSPFIQISSWKELDATILRLLRDDESIKMLRLATLNWYAENCTPQKVAARMYSNLFRSFD